jgi:polysaccharide biosynthesis/export protein ExoF
VRWLAICSALLLLPFVKAALADDGLIAPSDMLALRVTDWQSADGELREWVAITGAYAVDADGNATFPYIGEIAVAGQSPAAVGDIIGEALKQRFALPDLPYASVSIDARRPVLVGGAVERPGEVAYMAGMTGRHAVALAGGILAPDGGESSIMVQSLTAEAQVRILTDQAAAGALRVARLRAELDGSDEIAVDDLTTMGGPMFAVLRADAERHLSLNRQRLKAELDFIESKVALLEQEIVALEAKEIALNRQKALADEQRAATAELTERGLAVNARLLDAERTLVTVETQVLDVATTLLQARQQLEAAKADLQNLVQDRHAEIMQELQTAEVELVELRERLGLQRSVAGLLSASLGGETEEGSVTVVIYRGGSGDPQVIRDGMDTVLRPGDLVEVALTPAVLRNPG